MKILTLEPERHPGQDEPHGTNVMAEASVSGRPAVVFFDVVDDFEEVC